MKTYPTILNEVVSVHPSLKKRLQQLWSEIEGGMRSLVFVWGMRSLVGVGNAIALVGVGNAIAIIGVGSAIAPHLPITYSDPSELPFTQLQILCIFVVRVA